MKLDALAARFGAGRVDALLDGFDAVLAGVAEDDGADPDRLERAAHALAGLAGVFGFDDAGASARRLEGALRRGADVAAAHRSAIADCRAVRHALASRATPA